MGMLHARLFISRIVQQLDINTPPTSFSQGTPSNCAAKNVNPIRSTTATAAPKVIPSFRSFGVSDFTAMAMTTALSPASNRSINTIFKISITNWREISGIPMAECSVYTFMPPGHIFSPYPDVRASTASTSNIR